jgi:tetratricopeptide (TPR) repeat protein
LAALLCGQVAVVAQGGASEAGKAAAALYRAQEWEKAITAYEKLLVDESKFGIGWVHLGISYYNLKQYRKSIEANRRAVELGFAPQIAHYNIAAAHSLLGETDEAFAALEKVAAAGYGNAGQFEKDEDYAALREDSRFAAVLLQMKINSAPCEHLPEYRQFDFWIGDWEVFSPQGRKVGTNRIEKMDNGCILLENWVGAGGGPGKSLNYYDHTTKEWVQIWIGGTGVILPARGGIKDGAMYLEGTRYLRDGTTQLYRGTWTPLEDGRVRQFLELSADEGKTWNVWFEGFYARKEK